MVVLYFGFLLMLLVFALEMHGEEGRVHGASHPGPQQIPLRLHAVVLTAATREPVPVVRPPR